MAESEQGRQQPVSTDRPDGLDGGTGRGSGARVRGLIGAVAIVGLIVAAVGVAVFVWLRSSTAQSVERVERDHGIELPESAQEVQAMGDLFRLVDHGRSSIFVIDSADLDQLVDQLDKIDDVSYSTFVPGNAQYRPDRVPWPPDATPEDSFGKTSPAGGDFMHVEIYRVDASHLEVWIYSDWN